MARFVLHHRGVDRPGQGIGGVVADQAERRERQALDEHLHREVRHVPTTIGERVVEQRLEIVVHRIHELELLVQMVESMLS